MRPIPAGCAIFGSNIEFITGSNPAGPAEQIWTVIKIEKPRNSKHGLFCYGAVTGNGGFEEISSEDKPQEYRQENDEQGEPEGEPNLNPPDDFRLPHFLKEVTDDWCGLQLFVWVHLSSTFLWEY
jgi:hypothetical protein